MPLGANVKRLTLPLVMMTLALVACDETPSVPQPFIGVSMTATVTPAGPNGEQALLVAQVVNQGEPIHRFSDPCDSLRSGISVQLTSPIGERVYLESYYAREVCVPLVPYRAESQAVLERGTTLYGIVYDIDDHSTAMIPGIWRATLIFRFADTTRDTPDRQLTYTVNFDWPPTAAAPGLNQRNKTLPAALDPPGVTRR